MRPLVMLSEVETSPTIRYSPHKKRTKYGFFGCFDENLHCPYNVRTTLDFIKNIPILYVYCVGLLASLVATEAYGLGKQTGIFTQPKKKTILREGAKIAPSRHVERSRNIYYL